MHTERLQQMVTMLRGLTATAKLGFDLGDWHCGTAACAVGHACLSPWFQEQGLTLTRSGWGKSLEPNFGEYAGWEAAEQFFDLDSDDAEYLFYRYSYADEDLDPDAETVANRIERFIAENAEV